MILGRHTLDETRDLLAKADYLFKKTGTAFTALNPAPLDIANDWAILSAAWSTDRKSIANGLLEHAIKGFPAPSSIIPTEDEWTKIINYIQFQENVKGSLQDITARIQAAGSHIDYSDEPQGKATQDVDLALFKQLDDTTKKLDKASEEAKKKAYEAMSSETGILIGVGAAATLIGIVAVKHYL